MFAWSGGAVLLTTRYLADVGLFDEQLFLYYEDVDLSWRERQRGWRYRYVPGVGRAACALGLDRRRVAALRLQRERNRLLTLTRHADRRTVAKALARYLLVTGSYTRRDVVSPLLRGQAPRLEAPLRRLRALGGYAAVMVSRR